MTSKKREIFDRWLTVSHFLIQATSLLDDGDRFALSQLLARLENPPGPMEELTDVLERWATGRKDPRAFCPSTLLWEDWLEWCRRTGERPGTLPAFYARLKTKAWLREGRTRVAGVPRNGWWGLKGFKEEAGI